MYRIVEDEFGKYWVAKITANRVVLNEGSWSWLEKLPNTAGNILYLSDLREGRVVRVNGNRLPIYI